MNLKWFQRKDVLAIDTMKTIAAVQTWEVRWTAMRQGIAHQYPSLRPEIEVFTSEADAIAFADSLAAAFKLVKCTNCTEVTVRIHL